MKFLLYTKIGEDTVKQSLGLPEYSYYFVYKEFKTIFAKFGDIVSVQSEEDIHAQYRIAAEQGETCVVVFFCPPHVAPDVLPYPSFCVLAWEFDTIPDEVWDEDPRNDWRVTFNRHLGLICLSSHTHAVVKRVMGEQYPVSAISVPVWERFSNMALAADTAETHRIQIDGNIIDSHNYKIDSDTFCMKDSVNNFQITPWDGQPLNFSFDIDHQDSAFLGGFYRAEPWGSWSRLKQPWLFLQTQLSGDFVLELQASGFGLTVGKQVCVIIGKVTQSFILAPQSSVYRLQFKDVEPSNLVEFKGLDIRYHGYDLDPRTMALGLEKLSITDSQPHRPPTPGLSKITDLWLDGVVYTTVFNPMDARKNWEKIVSAFCYAFKNHDDATLVLKVSSQHLSSIMGRLHFLLQQIGEIQCRVVAIHGYLPENNYLSLIGATDYYVNASSGEGLCLPLMEFMACGVPAIAPHHTSMLDYSDNESSFLLDSSLQPDIWPHDTRMLMRTRSYRISWQSLVDQYRTSYQVIRRNKSGYLRKSIRAKNNIKNISNQALVVAKVDGFLRSVGLINDGVNEN